MQWHRRRSQRPRAPASQASANAHATIAIYLISFVTMQIRYTAVAMSILAASCGPSTQPAASTSAPPSVVTSSEVSGVVPRNAIVTLLPRSGPPPAPPDAALMDQISKQFIPAVLLVQPGQP